MKVSQERDQLPHRTLTGVGVGLVAATAVFVLVAWLLLRCTESPGLAPPARDQPPPDEVNRMELTLFDTLPRPLSAYAVKRVWLRSYGWIDRDRGLVHIPIERAIELYLEREPEEARR